MRSFSHSFALICVCACAVSVFGERLELLTGVENRLYPGADRTVLPSSFPMSGVPGTFNDGDRLAGTSDVGPTIIYQGNPPQPLFDPNAFGSLSMLFRRGSVPLGPTGRLPFMGIEFLGGPLLDLDGDLTNGVRSLIPVTGRTAVPIPNSTSFIDLAFYPSIGRVELLGLDATGTNEGGPGAGPEVATIVAVLAGTQPNGTRGGAINPAIDTRSGGLTPFLGTSGMLAGVWSIDDLGYEIWEDTLLNSPSTGPLLGTLQFLGRFNGWLIERGSGGAWPTLAGQGLGTTAWPEIDTSAVGQSFATANGAAGGLATITTGPTGDTFTAPGNGGVALSDFGGDLGRYLDEVVLPRIPGDARRLVYLEAAGFGINNSFDPIFVDTVSYDAVIIAAGGRCDRAQICDANCDGDVDFDDINCFVSALVSETAWAECVLPGACDYRCANDINDDGSVDFDDINRFVVCLTLP